MKSDLKLNPADVKALRRKIRNLEALDKTGIQTAIRTSASTAVNIAKRKAPVDTGNLRNNIGYERSADGKEVEVFSKAPYSGYVEFGTIRQNAQPYFMPAIRLAVVQLRREIELLIKKAML